MLNNVNFCINAFGNDTLGLSFRIFSVLEANSGSTFGVLGDVVRISSMMISTISNLMV